MDNDTIKQVEQKALSLPEQAHKLTKVDDSNKDDAAQILTNIKALRKEVDAAFDPIKKKTYDAYKEVLAQKAKAEEPLDAAEKYIKGLIADYTIEQQKQRREEMRLAQEAAQKKAEQEALDMAVQAERAGDTDLADRIIEAPVVVSSVAAPKPADVKMSGVSTRKSYTFTITNEAAIPRKYLVPDLVAIRKVVNALGDKADIPGVTVVESVSVSARSSRS